MLRKALALALSVGLAGVAASTGSTASAAAEATSHSISVTGTEVGMYPAFDPATTRYAVTTTEATAGALTVHAQTSDPDGSVRVNGRSASGGKASLTGLRAGDEVSVLIEDGAGKAAYSLVYLPAGFPTLAATTKEPGVAPGLVGLTLTQWNQPTPSFETAVDVNGVPAHVFAPPAGTLDLKLQPNGSYSVSRTTTTPGRTGSAVVELDSSFTEVARHETVGLVDTDGHDSILQPDGSRIFVAYETNDDTGLVDAVIQQVDPTGAVVFEWNSHDAGLESETVAGGRADYAHINSVFVMKDGDILASFRHLSAVLKIARSAHDGYEVGDVVWRLGGRRSDFVFADDPYPGGPCAQHTATELANGNILIYDNGSGFGGSFCVDPADPTGPTVPRPTTRVTEYDLGTVDNDPGTEETATLVWDYEPGRFAFFAGSSQRLSNGNTLVGWAAHRAAVATEVDEAGAVVWELRDTVDAESPNYSTYRASRFPLRDSIDPEVRVRVPGAGASYVAGSKVVVDVQCTDRGGSTLQTCAGTASSGDLLDTTAGTHTLHAVATDGAGNETAVARSYTVVPRRYRPDGSIRVLDGPWVGDNVYGGPALQHVNQKISRPGGRAVSVLRIQNDGNVGDRLRVEGTARSRKFRVAYFAGGENVTRQVTSGRFRTTRLAPGKAQRIRVRVVRTRAAQPGDTRAFRMRVWSLTAGTRDAVATRVRATRG